MPEACAACGAANPDLVERHGERVCRHERACQGRVMLEAGIPAGLAAVHAQGPPRVPTMEGEMLVLERVEGGKDVHLVAQLFNWALKVGDVGDTSYHDIWEYLVLEDAAMAWGRWPNPPEGWVRHLAPGQPIERGSST